MSAPSWPRLVGWMATAQVQTARGRWREVEDGEQRSGTFAFRAPRDWAVVADDGQHAEGPRRLWPTRFVRQDDYCRAAGPVTAVRHSGRRCWQVDLVPPPRKRGLLSLAVDEETGLCLRLANVEHGRVLEVVDLEVDPDLPEAAFSALQAERADGERVQARYDLLMSRPPPTPRWFPWRRTWVEHADCLSLDGLGGDGTLGRAPLGSRAPVSEFVPEERVHRLDHAGWSWAVAPHREISAEQARRVVEQVVELPG